MGIASQSTGHNDDPVPFPENANYGCVDCGSINHTTGDAAWCKVAQNRHALVACFPGCGWNDEVQLEDGWWTCPGCGEVRQFLSHRDTTTNASSKPSNG